MNSRSSHSTYCISGHLEIHSEILWEGEVPLTLSLKASIIDDIYSVFVNKMTFQWILRSLYISYRHHFFLAIIFFYSLLLWERTFCLSVLVEIRSPPLCILVLVHSHLSWRRLQALMFCLNNGEAKELSCWFFFCLPFSDRDHRVTEGWKKKHF